mmetsp:Transcript_15479/g.63144  ORF Transcript_15479/g.63144 Transcript_15479/m.63144 type:complete len:526 (-) Transcript_15479:456-2033(-)
MSFLAEPTLKKPAPPNEDVVVDVVELMLTEQEKRLFDLMKDVVRKNKLGTTLRVAGGWVRDKILNFKMEDSKAVDIDIALDNMLGCDFAILVNRWLEENGEEHHDFGVMHKNSEKSKHLETARVKVLGLSIDLVNLRTETYTEDSRIPTAKIGTPLEDALRRDLTINSLFYNINTGKIEDFTRVGYLHLQKRIIKTPLPPLTTLLDDPLRVLRAMRFANRFNFNVDEELYTAFCDPEVHQALDEKVSRERIGQEVDLMISSDRPLQAIGLMCEVGIFHIVFRLPDTLLELPPFDLRNACLGCLINLDSLIHHHFDGMRHTAADLRLARYAAITAPLRNVRYECERRHRPTPVTRHVLQNELRMNSKTVDSVYAVHEASIEFQFLMHLGLNNIDRLRVADILRKVGPLWKLGMMTALITEMYPAKTSRTYAEALDTIPDEFERPERMIVANYKLLQNTIESLKLEGVWDMKPYINGEELMQLLPKLPRGPKIGDVSDGLITWQIQNPDKSVSEARCWLVETFAQYK